MTIISWLNDQSVEGDLRGWNVWWWRAGTGDNGPWRPANTKHCSATLQGKYCHTHPYKWGCTSAPPALLGPTQCAVNKRSLNFSIVVSTEACLGAKMDIFMQCQLATIPWKLFNRQQSPVNGRRWKYTRSLGRRSQTQLHTALTAHITHNPCHDEEDFLSPLKQYSRVSHAHKNSEGHLLYLLYFFVYEADLYILMLYVSRSFTLFKI